MSTASLHRLVESLARTGTVFAVDLERVPPCVRVTSGALETDWLPWLVLRNGTTKTWDPPTVGEPVLVLSFSGDTATGFALPSYNSAEAPPPSTSPDEHLRVYPDGARVLYNHATSHLEVTGIRTALIQAAEEITIDCPKTVFTGDVEIQGKLTVGGGGSLSGAFDHTGGGFVSNGITVHTHTHPKTGGPLG